MRLRVQTQAPLPELKAWFIPDDPIPPLTIYDLKDALLHRIPQLKDARIRKRDLVLLLDDFELLNDTPFSAVRDGDLVCVKLAASPKVLDAKRVSKRKRSSSQEEEIRATKRKITPPSQTRKQLLSSHRHHVLSTKSAPFKTYPQNSRVAQSSNRKHTPPIPRHAKPEQRRRLKHKYEKEESATGPAVPKGASAPNLVPLGSRSEHDDVPAPQPQHRLSKFRLLWWWIQRSQEAHIGQLSYRRTSPHVHPAQQEQKERVQAIFRLRFCSYQNRLFNRHNSCPLHYSRSRSTTTPTPPNPPSELQSLGQIPSNMFITSIDVEEGLWEDHTKENRKKKRGKRKDAEKFQAGSGALIGTRMRVIPSIRMWMWMMDLSMRGVRRRRMWMCCLTARRGAREKNNEFDWVYAEKMWEGGEEVSTLEQVVPDKLVGWMALAINPRTFSPEILLNVARIISTDASTVKVRPLLRPANGEAAFSFGLGDGEEEEVDYPWETSSVQNGDYSSKSFWHCMNEVYA
ncbi:hypothetical protein BDQ17DRAFT_1513240 [Cyathus striatus]|nr:hypothetical protein BDQ17DRAFT_1513240 [Cyathus striatus]